jgi:hypothetical protein
MGSPTKSASSKTNAPEKYNVAILRWKRKLDALWEASPAKNNMELKIGVPGAFCLAREFYAFMHTNATNGEVS